MDFQEKIIEHLSKFWNTEPNIYLFTKGPFDKLPYNYRVLEFAPKLDRDYWFYSTCCMSQKEDKKRIELFILSHQKDESLIELLTTVAYYHRNTSKLDLNHTVNFGQPWQKSSECTFGFISLPYLQGPSLENLNLTTQESVNFYWLIPITNAELEYKKENGVEKLEDLFESKNLDYLNSERPSLI